MKKTIIFILTIFCIFSLCGCNNDLATKDEEINLDYGKITDLAKAEFANVLKDLKI